MNSYERNMEAGAVSVRLHHGGPQGAKPKGEVVAEMLAAVKERRALLGVNEERAYDFWTEHKNSDEISDEMRGGSNH